MYSLKGVHLEVVESSMYLGINIIKLNDLTWHKQVYKVVAKDTKALAFMKRNMKTKSGATKELTYKALVRPTVELYG